MLFLSLFADTQWLFDSGVGQWEVLEGPKASGALLCSHHGPAAAPAPAEVPAPPEGRMRSCRPLACSSNPQLFTATRKWALLPWRTNIKVESFDILSQTDPNWEKQKNWSAAEELSDQKVLNNSDDHLSMVRRESDQVGQDLTSAAAAGLAFPSALCS